jgi:hypothetical protein
MEPVLRSAGRANIVSFTPTAQAARAFGDRVFITVIGAEGTEAISR